MEREENKNRVRRAGDEGKRIKRKMRKERKV
jgi:hypothetical protein